MARKQTEIPGTERKKIAELDTAAEHYVEQRDKRMKLTEKEHEAKETLITVMRKHKQDIYRDTDAGLIITLVPGKDGVKVSEAKEAEEDGGEESQRELGT